MTVNPVTIREHTQSTKIVSLTEPVKHAVIMIIRKEKH